MPNNYTDQPSLFDQPRPVVNTSLVNKIESFHSKEVQLKRGTQKEQIFRALCGLRLASHRELSEATGIPRHLVPDRVKILIKDNLVEEFGEKLDPLTHKTVTTYRVKTN
ncbi:MAG TPA: hypothetical protein VHO03_16565 [Ignavibacteriales bacterium]|nr:hypothetical protein [Ignavibacteriales bacterium]